MSDVLVSLIFNQPHPVFPVKLTRGLGILVKETVLVDENCDFFSLQIMFNISVNLIGPKSIRISCSKNYFILL